MMLSQKLAQELISKAYSPQILYFISDDAAQVSSKNNLNFTTLLKPFSSLTTQVSWQESSGTAVWPKYLKLTPLDSLASEKTNNDRELKNSLFLQVAKNIPPSAQLESDKLDKNGREKYKSYSFKNSSKSIEVVESTPWYSSYIEFLLNNLKDGRRVSYLSHFHAAVLVLSSNEEISDLATLVKRQMKSQETSRNWAFSSCLKFYLVLHDNSSGDHLKADQLYQQLRTTYGANFCYLLKINSKSSSPPSQNYPDKSGDNSINSDLWQPYLNDEKEVRGGGESKAKNVNISHLPHPLSPDEEEVPFPQQNGNLATDDGSNSASNSPRGYLLSTEDLGNVQVFTNEFIAKGLLPHVERQCRILHESILNRRSMSKSFFGATKRLFGSGAKNAAPVYSEESLEMSVRKLADMYFLFGNYSGAYQLYHQLKKDFQADGAWSYYGSALEMAALSHFMMTQQEAPGLGARSFPIHYVSEAIRIYLDSSTKMTDEAVRCAALCCECLKQVENYGEAGAVYIRLTSEECDLRSALMLEQAAYCFLHQSLPRKFALHSVLAGHRYGKASLRAHSLSCYLQGAQVYQGRGWRFAEDHMNLIVGKHLSFLHPSSNFSSYLTSLFLPFSPQPPPLLSSYFQDVLTLLSSSPLQKERVQFHFVPLLIFRKMVVKVGLLGGGGGVIEEGSEEEEEEDIWDKLEEGLLKEISSCKYKRTRMAMREKTKNNERLSVPVNETFYVEIPFQNPFLFDIELEDIFLNFNQSEGVISSKVQSLTLHPSETKIIRFSVNCSKVCTLVYTSVYYNLVNFGMSVGCEQKITLRGPRLNQSKKEKSGVFNGLDLRNQISITPPFPLLQIKIPQFPTRLFHSQSVPFKIALLNSSSPPHLLSSISKISLGCPPISFPHSHSSSSSPHYLAMDEFRNEVEGQYCAQLSGDSFEMRVVGIYESGGEYRVSRGSVRGTLVPTLKVDFKMLKNSDCGVGLALLKIQNLTEAHELVWNSLSLSPPEFTLLQITPPHLNSIKPTEVESLLLKFTRSQNTTPSSSPPPSLSVHWTIPQFSPSPISGTYEINIQNSILNNTKNSPPLLFSPSPPFDLASLLTFIRPSAQVSNFHDFSANGLYEHVFNLRFWAHWSAEDELRVRVEKIKMDGGSLCGQRKWVKKIGPESKVIEIELGVGVRWPGVYKLEAELSFELRGEVKLVTIEKPIVVVNGQNSSLKSLCREVEKKCC